MTHEYDIRADILAFELVKGVIPDDVEIEKSCKNMSCVSPNHIRLLGINDLFPAANALSPEQVGYIAGIIDGEGTIHIVRHHHGLHTGHIDHLSYDTELVIGMTTKAPLDLFQKSYGGYIQFLDKSKKDGNLNDVFVYHLYSKIALRKVLLSVLPLLTVKHYQAELMLKFIKQRGRNHGQGNRLTDSDKLLVDQMYKLNRRGRKKDD